MCAARHAFQDPGKAVVGDAYDRGLTDPLPANRPTVAAGAHLYRTHCTACHGPGGAGNGPAAAALSPPPANLTWLMRLPIASDGYLMWTISDGGAALGSAMPAFKPALSDTERWQLVRYLQTRR